MCVEFEFILAKNFSSSTTLTVWMFECLLAQLLLIVCPIPTLCYPLLLTPSHYALLRFSILFSLRNLTKVETLRSSSARGCITAAQFQGLYFVCYLVPMLTAFLQQLRFTLGIYVCMYVCM